MSIILLVTVLCINDWSPDLNSIYGCGTYGQIFCPITLMCFIIIGATIKACTLVVVVHRVNIVLDIARGISTMVDDTKSVTEMDTALKAGISIGVDRA